MSSLLEISGLHTSFGGEFLTEADYRDEFVSS